MENSKDGGVGPSTEVRVVLRAIYRESKENAMNEGS